MKYLLLTVLSSIYISTSFAQGVTITEHDGINSLLSSYVNYHKSNPMISGYRIKIIATDDRLKMENALAKFQRLYPGIRADWKHEVPYYQVSVGAFKEKLDYQGFLIEVKKDFHGSIPVVADIYKEELLKQ